MTAKSGNRTIRGIILVLCIGYTVSVLLLAASGVLDIEKRIHLFRGRSFGPDFEGAFVSVLPFLGILIGIQIVSCILVPWRWLKLILFVLALPVALLIASICVGEANREGGRFVMWKRDGTVAMKFRCACLPFCWFNDTVHPTWKGQPSPKEYDPKKWFDENLEEVNFEYPPRRKAAFLFILSYLILIIGSVALYDNPYLNRIFASKVNDTPAIIPSQNRAPIAKGNLQQLLEQNGKVSFGRAADNDIVLDDDYISDYHAEICSVQGRLFVRDLDSSNGTFINDEAVKETTALNNSDKLRIGTIICSINCDDIQNSDLANRSSKETVKAKPAKDL